MFREIDMVAGPMAASRLPLQVDSSQPAFRLDGVLVGEVDRLMNHHHADASIDERLQFFHTLRRTQKRLFPSTICVKYDGVGTIEQMFVFWPTRIDPYRFDSLRLLEQCREQMLRVYFVVPVFNGKRLGSGDRLL